MSGLASLIPSAYMITLFSQRLPHLLAGLLIGLILMAPRTSADPADQEFRQLLLADEHALGQIDRILANDSAFARQGAGMEEALIATKIRTLSAPVIKKYEAFLARHPNHVKGHLAYASFLGEFGREAEARPHLDEAIRLAPNDPVALNNAANYYGKNGPAVKAFEYYQKAIAVKPAESTYHRNCASVMLLYRPEAQAYFKLQNEQAVFVKALALYRQAQNLNADDFLLASDVAQTHYHIRPFPYRAAVDAWGRALKLTSTSTQTEGVMIHLARIHIRQKNFKEARVNLLEIIHPEFQEVKRKLLAEIPAEMKKFNHRTSKRRPISLYNLSTSPPSR